MSLDPYTPEDQIAVGPSGKIYRGRIVATGRIVRIKALLGSQHISCPVDRPAIEATLPFVLNLEHPQVSRLLDIDFDDDDFAIVSEFSPGLTGWEFIHQRQLTPADARGIAAQMITALIAGEGIQLHHGDIKLSNVILDDHPGGFTLQLQDWGLSSCRTNQPDETRWFRAPERLDGGDATTASDLFSVGATMVALMTGHTAVQGSNAEQLRAAWAAFDPMAIRQQRPDIDAAFHDWLVWLLRMDPAMRPGTAQQALDMLHSGGMNYAYAVPLMPVYAPPMWPAPPPTASQPLIATPPTPTASPAPKPVSKPPVRTVEAQPEALPVPAKKPRTRGMATVVMNLSVLVILIGFLLWMRSNWGPHWPDHLRRLITGQPVNSSDEPSVKVATWPPASLSSEGVLGQFVRVEIPGPATLNLAEIEIISLGSNVARAGKATAKDSDFGGKPALVNDGNLSGEWAHKSIYHSKERTETPWVEIDLGSEQPIRAIRLWNRTDRDEFTKRLANYSVIIFSKDRSVRWRIDGQPTPDEPSMTFNVTPPH